MALTTNIDILVVTIDDNIIEEMRYVADSRGWAVLQCPSLRQAMKQVVAVQPKVVIVQVSDRYDKAIQLIRMLQTGWRRLAVIVVSTDHSHQCEREVRTAGASVYLPSHEAIGKVDRYVSAMVKTAVEPAPGRITHESTDYPLFDRKPVRH